jgi:xylulokinase
MRKAMAQAGGVDDVDAIAVGGQQHGLVTLDDRGEVVRAALLWNDTRSAKSADDLLHELPGGAAAWADAVNSVPVAAFTVTKLRWLATHEPANAARTAAVCLPHDWLTWQLSGASDLGALVTDRSDASGTGYWSPAGGEYREDLLELAFGSIPILPRVVPADQSAGELRGVSTVLGPGAGDNAAACLGVGAAPGDLVVSIGTSGVVCAVTSTPTADASGLVAGFADATGRFLPLVCTLNAARVLDAMARLLAVSLEGLSDLALSAPAGSGGLVVVPYLEGERTPNRPDATGAIHGLSLDNLTPANLARAAVEGVLCGLADGVDALLAQGVNVARAVLIGGGARSSAVQHLAPAILGMQVVVPDSREYVADGAARQAAWVLSGDEAPPTWGLDEQSVHEADPTPLVRERYAAVRDLTGERQLTA